MSIGTDSQSSSQHLSSHSSLNHSKKSSTEISKTYKHASQLFLTRRLAEAYEALRPVIIVSSQINGYSRSEDDAHLLAPIATATTSQRIKIWSLYVTLLNAIVDLGQDEGKREFEQKEYREIVRLVQSGEVWEQVVRNGYRDREDSVDAEVVYNLSTLLLGQAQTQTLNQTRLETYLSSSATPFAGLDISTQLGESFRNGRRSQLNGTSTPKDLTSRIKILELFTLHVLPRNDEWDYARSFIGNSDILDEERREAFLQTLEELQEVKEREELLDEEVVEDETEDETPAPQPDANVANESNLDGTYKGHRRTSSEVDYGIEKAHPNGNHHYTPKPPTTVPPSSKAQMTNLPPQSEPTDPIARSHLSPPAQTPRRPTRRPKAQAQNTLMAQARQLFSALTNLARNMVGAVTSNPRALFRMMLFLLAFLMAYSRKEVRERVQRFVRSSWTKVQATVGMGVKVSYI